MGRIKRKRKRKEKNKPCTDEDVIQLQKWLRLKKTKLKVFSFKDTGRGLKCVGKIEAGEELIQIPLQYLIKSDTNCNLSSVLCFARSSPQLRITAYLLYEWHLKDLSKFFVWIKLLPQGYSNLFFCNVDEKRLLPKSLKNSLIQQSRKIKESFNFLMENMSSKLCPHCNLPLKAFFCYDKFLWSWFTVNTRAVHYEDNGTNSLALAPFLDMFNHSNDANVELKIDVQNNAYILKTLKSYKKHEQVFIRYGSHSNHTLLLEYGFILFENPNDFVEFTFEEIIEVVKSYNYNYGQLDKFKYALIMKNNLNKDLRKYKEEFSWNFNGLIYVLITKDEDLSLIQAKTYSGKIDPEESRIKEEISREIVSRKKKYFCDILYKMETIMNCTLSFSLAKDLIRIYINFLS